LLPGFLSTPGGHTDASDDPVEDAFDAPDDGGGL
jgi:hypothetical protein